MSSRRRLVRGLVPSAILLGAVTLAAQTPAPVGPPPEPFPLVLGFGSGLGSGVSGLVGFYNWRLVADLGRLGLSWISPNVEASYGWFYPSTGERDPFTGLPVQSEFTYDTADLAAGLALHRRLGGGAFAARVSGGIGPFYARAPDPNAPELEWTPRLSFLGGGLGLVVQGSASIGLALFTPFEFSIGVGARWPVGLGPEMDLYTQLRWYNDGGVARYYSGRRGVFSPKAAPPGQHWSIPEGRIDPVFPVLFRYYATNPFGALRLRNATRYTLRNVHVRFHQQQYAPTPQQVAEFPEVEPGGSREVPLSLLFDDGVLEITEGTELTAQVDVAYVVDGFDASFQQDLKIPFYDRNSVRWDDDRKVATFVTAKDEEVLRFAKTTAGVARQERAEALPLAFRDAVAAFEALSSHGMSYVVDPNSSYARLSADTSAVDYVQFPRQTLQYRGGDCDDLSVLYDAILEAMGVESGFITVPGHIYAAVRLDPAEARRAFVDSESLITSEEGDLWLPVELTALGRGFAEAWRLGALQWREGTAAGTARLYPTHAAWQAYAPVSFGVSKGSVEDLPLADVRRRFRQSMDRIVRDQVEPQVALLQASHKDNSQDPRTLNRIGALYARYGLFDQAKEYLQPLTEGNVGTDALVNLGNIALLEGDLGPARDLFRRALERDPDNVPAHLGLVQALASLGDREAARIALTELGRLDPEAASRLSYLGDASSGARAEQADQTRIIWSDPPPQP